MIAFELSRQRAAWLTEQILPHEPALRAWLSGRLGNVRMEVDDVVQETYAVLAGMHELSHVRDPRAYLFTAARSVVLQQVRRARIVSIETVAEIDRVAIPRDTLSPDRHADACQQLRQIGTLIAALPTKCRQAFLLRKVEGLSQREIAQRMGISENTVEKHIGKGLRLLMAALAKAEGSCGSNRVDTDSAGIEDGYAGMTQRHED